MNLTKTLIDAIGLDYLRRRLATGKTLSRLVAPKLHVETHLAWAILPKPRESSQLVEFDSGDVGTTGLTRITWDYMGQMIDSIVTAERVCILENPLVKRGDPALKRKRSRLVFHGEEVYHIVDADSPPGRTSCADMLKEAASMFAVHGFIINRNGISLPERNESVSEEQLQKCAEQSQAVFVGAYDGEGFVMACIIGSPEAKFLSDVTRI